MKKLITSLLVAATLSLQALPFWGTSTNQTPPTLNPAYAPTVPTTTPPSSSPLPPTTTGSISTLASPTSSGAISATDYATAMSTPFACAQPVTMRTPNVVLFDLWRAFGNNVNFQNVTNQMALYNSLIRPYQPAALIFPVLTLDDGTFLSTRDANGNLIINPTNFPTGVSGLIAAAQSYGFGIKCYTEGRDLTGVGSAGMGTGKNIEHDSQWFATKGFCGMRIDFGNANILRRAVTAFRSAAVVSNQYYFSGVNVNNDPQLSQYFNMTFGSGFDAGAITSTNVYDYFNKYAKIMLARQWLKMPGSWYMGQVVVNNERLEISTNDFSLNAVLGNPASFTTLAGVLPGQYGAMQVPEMWQIVLDPLCATAFVAVNDTNQFVPARRLNDGSIIAQIIPQNATSNAAPSSAGFSFASLGIPAGRNCRVRDVLAQNDLGTYANGFTNASISSWCAPLYRVTPVSDLATNTFNFNPGNLVQNVNGWNNPNQAYGAYTAGLNGIMGLATPLLPVLTGSQWVGSWVFPPSLMNGKSNAKISFYFVSTNALTTNGMTVHLYGWTINGNVDTSITVRNPSTNFAPFTLTGTLVGTNQFTDMVLENVSTNGGSIYLVNGKIEFY